MDRDITVTAVPAEPNVVYVTGWGRSGSTLLNRLLVGEHVVGIGELRLLWQRGVLKRQHCSCGRVWDECELWHPVVQDVLGVHPEAETARAAERLHDLGRRAGYAISRRPHARTGSVQRYAQVLGDVYRSIVAHTGAQVIVDSSKSPAQALLARASGVKVTVVHLVRDPRGVVWSHRRAKAPPPGTAAATTQQHGPLYVATRWTIRNAFIDRQVEPDLRVRYEDMVADTEQVMKSIFSAAGIDVPPEAGGIEHLIAGNPSRFEPTRPKVLTEDAEWREAQSAGQRRITELVAGHVMRRYGYR